MNKKDIKINDKLFKLLVIVFSALAVILVVVWFANKNNLATDNKVVNELYNYFNSDDLTNCNGLFSYADKKIKYSDVDNETKMCISYHKTNLAKNDIEKETISKTKKKSTCTKDDMVFRAEEKKDKCTITKIKKELIDNTYKKLFGKKAIKTDSFMIDGLNICYQKDDYYYCGLSETYTITLGSETDIYRVIEKATEKSGVITIYDYFIKTNGDNCYYYYTTQDKNEECTSSYKPGKKVKYNFLKKYGTLYKHVYKESKDNVYYWVSSEPVKKG